MNPLQIKSNKGLTFEASHLLLSSKPLACLLFSLAEHSKIEAFPPLLLPLLLLPLPNNCEVHIISLKTQDNSLDLH